MPLNKDFIKRIEGIVGRERLMIEEPMKFHTTFNIGGIADYLIFPATVPEVVAVFQAIREFDMPCTVLGNGSNVLVLDGGIRGAVVKFHQPMNYIRQEGTRLIAGAGAYLKAVSEYAKECSLGGLEFACGIPGSLGGAVFMNAGAYDGEMSKIVESVKAVTLSGEIIDYNNDQINFAYRHSVFQDNAQIIAEITLKLEEREKTLIENRMAELTRMREQKQPLDKPSAGSTFKRPTGYYAGTLIDSSGLKGLKVGGTEISLKHAGFVVNTGNATAKDVLDLIKMVQDEVYKKNGVRLHPEVRIIGEE